VKRLRSPMIGILLCLFVPLMVGCAARANSGAAATAGTEDVVVDLPAIVLDVDENGQLSAADAESTQTALNPILNLALADVTLPADLTEQFAAAGVEQVWIETTPNGLSILVDGQPVLTPLWNEEILASTASALSELDLGDNASMMQLLPVIGNLGVGAVLRFSAADGSAIEPPDAATLPGAVPERPGTATQITIDYNEDGTWSGSGLPTFLPVPWDQVFTLPADTIQSLTDAGINSLQITTGSGGIFLRVNGQDLPFLDWTENRLQYTLQVVSEMGLIGGEAASILPTIQGVLPLIQGLGLDITLNMPQ